MLYYFALSVFISAFLIFQIQPMVGKLLLPWFGGAPAVWSTVMLFFQVLLTGGYAYAYGLVGRARPVRQGWIHLVFLALSGVALVVTALSWPAPILPGLSWRPGADVEPIGRIFLILTASVGLPYFLLASNGPLIQAWFNQRTTDDSPYRLYALSNFASLLALVTYPIFIEPWLSLYTQGWVWTGGYVIYLLVTGYAAWQAAHPKNAGTVESTKPTPAVSRPAPRAGVQIAWLLFSAGASILLLAITNRITQEVAVIPFLWVLPLTIYLLSFVFAFSSERWYNRPLFTLLMGVATIGFVWTIISPAGSILLQIGIYSLALWAGSMICHGELYRLRPHPQHLTSFYLMVSIGGALGGVAVNLVAPFIFKGYWELMFGIAFCWIMFAAATFIHQTSELKGRLRFAHDVTIGSFAACLVIFSVFYVSIANNGSAFVARNFYGVIRVMEKNADQPELHQYSLIHGITNHGSQFTAPDRRYQLTSYYTQGSGVSLAILNHPRYGQGMHVGVLGLGIGVLAAYGQPSDRYTMYEINPVVIDLAKGQGGYFSFVKDSKAQVTIIQGDARLELERQLAEGQPQNFDLLVLDVFSSDAIPVHLLTREAMALYLSHLAPGGVLAANITNQHLDLQPVVWQLAREFNLKMTVIYDAAESGLGYPSIWVLASRDSGLLSNPAILSRAQPMENYSTNIRLWTDDFSNLFQILR